MMETKPHNLKVQGFVEEISISAPNWKKGTKEESIESEPTSVLDNRCIPSPLNSSSSLSSSFNGGGNGVAMEDLSFGEDGSLLPWFIGEVDNPNLNLKHILQTSTPLDFHGDDELEGGNQNSGMDNFDLIGTNLDSSVCGYGNIGFFNEKGSLIGVNTNCIVTYAPQQGHMVVSDEKPLVGNPQFGFGQQEAQTIQNPNCYEPLLGYTELEDPFQPPAKRHNPGFALDPSVVHISNGEFSCMDHDLLRKQKQHDYSLLGQHNSQVVALHDDLVRVVDMFQTGNFTLTQVILARLNHQASLPGKPLVKAAAFCVKHELEKLLTMNNRPITPPLPKSLTLSDVIYKINAYKMFSEVSPVMQFVDFTCTQALLEALNDANAIHILDFDIGCGSLWASFIRELSLRKRGAPFLRITIFTSTSTHHPLEVALICDTILEFANGFGVSIDLKVVNLDMFDPTSCTLPNFHLDENEAIGVNFPISACSHCPFLLPPLLSLIKQCSPKIMTSFDRGCDNFDLSFPSHILRALDSCTNLIESLDGSSISSEIINKIEKFLVQPTIERAIMGRIHAPDKMEANKMHHWKSLLTSAGFFPLEFSNFTESQADHLLNRIPITGFRVEKRQASLVLSWQSKELVAVSAWRC